MKKQIIINGTPVEISPTTWKKLETIAAEKKTDISTAIKICLEKVK